MSAIVRIEQEDDVAFICLTKPPVNALGVALRAEIYSALATITSNDKVKAIVLYGEGRFFSAGADIKDLPRAAESPTLPELLKALNNCPKPVIASLHGVAFGGALELALAAHVRVGIVGLKLALPEVNLGLLPGAGGTQRLPRLVGIRAALDIICSAREVRDQEAVELGIVSKLVAGSAREAGLAAAKDVVAGRLVVSPTDSLLVSPDSEALTIWRDKLAQGLSAPQRAVEAIAASTLPISEGLQKERALFMKLMQSEERSALVHAFLAERETAKIPENAANKRDVASVGVVGGGTMGTGIAAAFSIAGLSVCVIEADDQRVANARKVIEKTLSGALQRGKLTEPAYNEAIDRLQVVSDMNALANVDLVVEAIFEDLEVKTTLFQQLDKLCKQGAILATNTSYLDVNQIAAVTSRPGDVVGLHFFSPAHIMRLLEVVVARDTSAEVVATVFELAKKLRKIPVRSGVCDGFIGNRILASYRKACEYVVLDGANFEQVDKALTGFGFAMGPFAVNDLAGLDIAWAARKRRASGRSPQERYSRVADLICDKSWYGRKTQRGYYVYKDGKMTGANPEAQAIVDEERSIIGKELQSFTDEDIVARCVTAIIQEAVLVLQEGIALRPIDIDAVKLFGYGFPRHRGGPLHMADQMGIDKLIQRIETYQKEDAFFWQVPDLLRDMAANGKSFKNFNEQYEAELNSVVVR